MAEIKIKTVKLEEDTRILINRARAKILSINPQQKKVTDNNVINTALKKYLGDKIGN